MGKKALGSYQRVQANTSSPLQRVVLVYNGINKNLSTAISTFGDNSPKKYETINNCVQLAEKLISELQHALDMDNGGEIAVQLNELYSFWIKHLSEGNREKDVTKLEEVLKMTEELTDGWVQAEKQLKTGGHES